MGICGIKLLAFFCVSCCIMGNEAQIDVDVAAGLDLKNVVGSLENLFQFDKWVDQSGKGKKCEEAKIGHAWEGVKAKCVRNGVCKVTALVEICGCNSNDPKSLINGKVTVLMKKGKVVNRDKKKVGIFAKVVTQLDAQCSVCTKGTNDIKVFKTYSVLPCGEISIGGELPGIGEVSVGTG